MSDKVLLLAEKCCQCFGRRIDPEMWSILVHVGCEINCRAKLPVVTGNSFQGANPVWRNVFNQMNKTVNNYQL